MSAIILKNPNECFDFANFFAKLTACCGDLIQFEQKIYQIANITGIDLSQFRIDHLAVRMNHISTAQQWRALLSEGGRLLKESEVNGRPIALFELYQPLSFCGQTVSVIELPFPKGKIYPQEGWEHIEIVMPLLKNEDILMWSSRICSQFKLDYLPDVQLKISQPNVIGQRLDNTTIAITLKNETYINHCCLKIHPYDIKSVIYSERN